MADTYAGKLQNPYAARFGSIPTYGPDADILTLYHDRKQKALRPLQNRFKDLLWYYDLYMMYYRGDYAGFYNNVQLPFIFSLIQSDVARKTQTLFGSFPYVDFIPTAADDTKIAQKVSTLISAQLRDCNSFLKAVDLFLSADINGTAIARIGYEHLTRWESWREPTGRTDSKGKSIDAIRTGNVVRFEGPNWENVDLLNFWPQPGKLRIWDMQYCFHRFWYDMDQIRALAAGGVYRKSAVRTLEAYSGPPTDEYNLYRNTYRNEFDFDLKATDPYSKPVCIVEMIGEVPSEFADDGVKMRIVTVANDGVVLRNVPFPYQHGHLPFAVFTPMVDPFSFYGIGKAAAAAKMQALSNKYASQKADAVDLNMAPMWLVNRLSGIELKSVVARAGKVIGADGPVGEENIRPFSPDLKGLQLAYTEIQQLWQWIQQATGEIEDTTMGIASKGEQTAHEFVGRQENVLTRKMFEAQIAENGFVERVADQMWANDRQFLPRPWQVRILGSEAGTDPITGLPIPQDPVVMEPQDFTQDYHAKSVGATQMMGKAMQQGNARVLVEMTQNNPAAAQVINWVSLFRYVFKKFDVPNVDDFFVKQVPMVNQMAQEQGTSPQQIVGAAGQALDGGNNIPPEVMQLLQGIGG